jgi:molybdenum cofactor synthesis domain-containing protein
VGDEIVSGRIVDTNGIMLSRLFLGAESRLVTLQCPDSVESIGRCLEFASQVGARLIVVSGGLGPTRDDLTRNAVASFAGVPLEWDEAAWGDILGVFSSRAVETVPENNKQQAYLPQGSVPLRNPLGTACGFEILVAASGVRVVCLPGVPLEFEAMLQRYMADVLGVGEGGGIQVGSDGGTKRMWPYPQPLHRSDVSESLLFGLGESAFEDRLFRLVAHADVADYSICAREGLLEVKLSWRDRQKASLLQECFQKEFDPYMVSQEFTPLAAQTSRVLSRSKRSLGVFDAVTRGYLLWVLHEGGLSDVDGGATSHWPIAAVDGFIFGELHSDPAQNLSGVLGCSAQEWLESGALRMMPALDFCAQHDFLLFVRSGRTQYCAESEVSIGAQYILLGKDSLAVPFKAFSSKQYFKERAELLGAGSRMAELGFGGAVSWSHSVRHHTRGHTASAAVRIELLRRLVTGALIGIHCLLGAGENA